MNTLEALLSTLMLMPCTQLSDGRAAEIGNALLATTEGGRMSSVASLQLHVASGDWSYDHAHFKGVMRRLLVPSAEDYDDQEYEEAAEEFLSAMKQLVAHSRLGWKYPWGVRLKVTQLLLAIVLRAQCEADADEAAELESLLVERLWPPLGISAAVHDSLMPFTNFQEYCRTGEAVQLERTKQLLPRLATAAVGSEGVAVEAADKPQPISRTVIDTVERHVIHQLSDFTATFPQGTSRMRGLIDVMRVAVECRSPGEGISRVLEGCIGASMLAACRRLASSCAPAAASTEEKLTAAARGVDGLFEDVLATYSPVLSADVPNTQSLAAWHLHMLLAPQLRAWLSSGMKLDQRGLDLIRTVLDLEEKLASHADHLQPLEPWGVTQHLQPVLYQWAAGQLGLLQAWTQRLMAAEDWKPVTQPRGCSRSCVEMLKMAEESLDALFAMKLPVPLDVARSLVEGIDTVLQRYVEGLMGRVGSPDALKPPLPPLTRYKRDVALKLQNMPSNGSTRPATLPHDNGRHQGRENGTPKAHQPPQPPPDLTTAALTCRLSSLDHLLIRLPALSASVLSRYDETSSTAGQAPWLEGLFGGAQQTIQLAADRLNAFIAARVVWQDLRQPLLEDVYRHSVQQARLGPVLELLDEALGSLCEATPKELHAGLGAALLGATVEALMRVLLHGGPCRWFIVDDVDMLEDDVQLLKRLFYADGEGLPSQRIIDLCAPLTAVLIVMQLDTGILIANFKQVKGQEKENGTARRPAALSGPAYDANIIVSVLAHRADRTASKFLKKELSLPKTDTSPNGLAGFTSGFSRLTTKMRNAM
ncbi:g8450 [Coccomyxa elongata]